jgi:hypothetical protein
VEQLLEDWPRIRTEISELKQENKQLKAALQESAILARKFNEYLGVDKTGSRAEELRFDTRGLLDNLEARLEIPRS